MASSGSDREKLEYIGPRYWVNSRGYWETEYRGYDTGKTYYVREYEDGKAWLYDEDGDELERWYGN